MGVLSAYCRVGAVWRVQSVRRQGGAARGNWGGVVSAAVGPRRRTGAPGALAGAVGLRADAGEADAPPADAGHDERAGDAGAGARTVTAERGTARALPGFEHALTHFRLLIAPWRVDLPLAGARALPAMAAVRTSPPPKASADWRWWPLNACADAALPVPARRLPALALIHI